MFGIEKEFNLSAQIRNSEGRSKCSDPSLNKVHALIWANVEKNKENVLH